MLFAKKSPDRSAVIYRLEPCAGCKRLTLPGRHPDCDQFVARRNMERERFIGAIRILSPYAQRSCIKQYEGATSLAEMAQALESTADLFGETEHVNREEIVGIHAGFIIFSNSNEEETLL